MKKNLKRVIVFLCLGIFLLRAENVSALASLSKFETGQASGKTMAPDFSLETIGDETVSLRDFRGNGIILFFFATWCPYCLQKMPELSKNYSQYQKENIKLLAIDAGENKAKVSSFAARENLPFDILLDTKMRTSDVYDVVGVPTFVLISKDGHIVYEGHDLPDDYKELLSR